MTHRLPMEEIRQGTPQPQRPLRQMVHQGQFRSLLQWSGRRRTPGPAAFWISPSSLVVKPPRLRVAGQHSPMRSEQWVRRTEGPSIPPRPSLTGRIDWQMTQIWSGLDQFAMSLGRPAIWVSGLGSGRCDPGPAGPLGPSWTSSAASGQLPDLGQGWNSWRQPLPHLLLTVDRWKPSLAHIAIEQSRPGSSRARHPPGMLPQWTAY